MSTFGEWLQGQRTLRRLTREEFAQRIGCSVAMLRKIETGERRPSAQIAGLIANALEIPLSEQATFIRVARGELGIGRLPQNRAAVGQPGGSRASSIRPNNLPISPSPLIGRQRELAELHRTVTASQCRLLTLVGPGGIGKTRLAIEAAGQLQDDFADGVYFVPLAPVDSPQFIVPVIAHAMGFSFPSAVSAEDPKTQLLNHLQEKRMLLLLDNFEHLLKEPGIELLAELLGCAPDVKLLVTSREPLTLQHEWVFEVQGLPVPEDAGGTQEAQDTSIELFLQRARRAHVGFDATTEDYPTILRICRLLGGTPLAIELAAAWVRTLTCEEIAQEIERGLDFLKSLARDLPARHRSMRAVFDHSWVLLSEDERQALARLSVFRGGFGREAAEQVAGAPLGILSALVAKSLVRRPEAGRYDLHELVRQYAEVVLESDPAAAVATRQRHYAFYLGLAEAAAPQLKGSGQLEWLRRLEQEHDNLRAALAWSLAGGRHNSALRLAAALGWFWQMRSYFHEGCGWLMKALEQGPEGGKDTTSVSAASPQGLSEPLNQRSVACALERLAHLTDSLGNHRDAHALAEQSAAIFQQLGDKQGLANALMTVGQTLLWQGEATLGRSRLEEALALYREVGDQWNVARSLYRLGNVMANFGSEGARRAMLDESAMILEELGGDKYLSAGLLISRGTIAYDAGDYGSARSLFDRSLSIGREIGDPWGTADALTNIGCILRTQGYFDSAHDHLEEALRVYQQCGSGLWCADPLCASVENEIARGNFSAASYYLGEASRYAENAAFRWLQVRLVYVQGLLAYYRGEVEQAVVLLEKTTELARGGGRFRTGLPQSLIALSRAMRAQRDTLGATVPLREGLTMFWKSDAKLGLATSLEAFAGLEAVAAPEKALRCFGAAEALRSAIGAPMPPIDQPGYERDIATARTQLSEAMYAEAWGRGQTMPLEAAVAEVLGA